MLCNIKICANSSFSLMSCYFNEIYDFVKESEYIFPSQFFGKKGPKIKIEDKLINYRFININDKDYNKMYDVFTTLHIKDQKRYIVL